MARIEDKQESTLARYGNWPTLESVVEVRRDANGIVGAQAFAIGEAEARLQYYHELATELLNRAQLAEKRLKKLQHAIDATGCEEVYEVL